MKEESKTKRRGFRLFIRQPELHKLTITETLLDVLEVIEDYRVTTKDVVAKSVKANKSYVDKILTICFHHGLVDRKRDEDEEEKPGLELRPGPSSRRVIVNLEDLGYSDNFAQAFDALGTFSELHPALHISGLQLNCFT